MKPFLSKYPYFLSQCKCYYIIPINIIHYALKHKGISLLLLLFLGENTYFPELSYTFAQCWCSCNKTCSCCFVMMLFVGAGRGGAQAGGGAGARGRARRGDAAAVLCWSQTRISLSARSL